MQGSGPQKEGVRPWEQEWGNFGVYLWEHSNLRFPLRCLWDGRRSCFPMDRVNFPSPGDHAKPWFEVDSSQDDILFRICSCLTSLFWEELEMYLANQENYYWMICAFYCIQLEERLFFWVLCMDSLDFKIDFIIKIYAPVFYLLNEGKKEAKINITLMSSFFK